MVRRCIAPNCTNTDQMVLCHRFPRKRTITYKWAQKLKVLHIKLEYLMDKYTVCCYHFEASDYRNIESNRLNLTACPTLKPHNPRFGTSSTIEEDKAPSSDDKKIHERYVKSECLAVQDNQITPGVFENINSELDVSPEHSVDDSVEMLPGSEEISEDDSSEGFPEYINGKRIDDVSILSGSDDENIANGENSCDYIMISGINIDTPIEDDEDQESATEVIPYRGTADVGIQVDNEELDQNDKENVELKKLSRKDLISLIQTQNEVIQEQQKKLDTFQKAHNNLLRSIDTFKSLMNV